MCKKKVLILIKTFSTKDKESKLFTLNYKYIKLVNL